MTAWEALVEIWKSVPDTYKSAGFAAALTYIPVLWQSRSSRRQLEIQLRHEREENKDKRTLELRKEIYLETIEAMTLAHARLGELPQLDFGKANIADGFKDFFAASAKFQLVAETETALLMSDLSASFAELLLEIARIALPLQKVKSQIAALSPIYETRQAEISRLLQLRGRINESGKPNNAEFDALSQILDRTMAMQDETMTELAALRTQEAAAQVEVLRQMIPGIKRSQQLQIRLLARSRADLGARADEALFMQHFNDQAKTADSRLDALAAGLTAYAAEP